MRLSSHLGLLIAIAMESHDGVLVLAYLRKALRSRRVEGGLARGGIESW